MRVDAHHHLWDLTRRPQPWMTGAWADSIRRTWTPSELAPHLAAHHLDATVVVQASASLAETRELLALSRESETVRAVVGWTDLTDPAGPELPSGLVGVRHQVEDEPDPGWLARADVRRGLAAVAEAGLLYELLVRPPQLAAAVQTVRALPQLRFVLDHAGKPPIADGDREAGEAWEHHLAQLAAEPHVVCKLSGLVTEADWHTWRPRDVLPYARRVLELFGPQRVLFGSDWPVCTLAAGYDAVVGLAEEATADLDPAERAAVFGDNAARVYGLSDDGTG